MFILYTCPLKPLHIFIKIKITIYAFCSLKCDVNQVKFFGWLLKKLCCIATECVSKHQHMLWTTALLPGGPSIKQNVLAKITIKCCNTLVIVCQSVRDVCFVRRNLRLTRADQSDIQRETPTSKPWYPSNADVFACNISLVVWRFFFYMYVWSWMQRNKTSHSAS